MNVQNKTRFIAQFSILLAIEALFCFTALGSLPIGPIVATLGMIPVILTAILLGPAAGSLMGFFFGLFSFIVWTFMPPPSSAVIAFVFTPFYSIGENQGNFGSLLICFLPRILIGTVTGTIFLLMKKLPQKLDFIRYVIAGATGSLVNTIGVLGGIWIFFGDAYSSIVGIAMSTILLTTLSVNGLLEAVISGASALFVCKPLRKALEKLGYSK